jgi:hypothetical protein
MNTPFKSSRLKELGPSRYWSKRCGFYISKECNQSIVMTGYIPWKYKNHIFYSRREEKYG